MKPKKKLNKFWNRSLFFYKVRYAILLKNIDSEELPKLNYNNYNPTDTIPKLYFKINNEIFKDKTKPKSDFDTVLQIATWLRNNLKGGRGLGVSSDKALKYMLAGNYGVCSDFCQVFNNFCVINNIKVREWGLLNTEVDKDGHSFNEFYVKELDQWIFIDVYNSIYFTSKSDFNEDKPLSASEVFKHNLIDIDKKMMIYNSDFQPNIKMIRKYYYSKNMQPFIIDKYRNRFYDKLLNSFDFLPIPFIHGLAILLNKSYIYKKIPLSSPTNDLSSVKPS